jgi:hypothetical protein
MVATLSTSEQRRSKPLLFVVRYQLSGFSGAFAPEYFEERITNN